MCKLQLDAVPLQASLHYPDHFEIMCISSILQNLLFIRTGFVQIINDAWYLQLNFPLLLLFLVPMSISRVIKNTGWLRNQY